MDETELRNRLITAALNVAAAERGGLDSHDAADELYRANGIFNDAARAYASKLAEG